MQETQVRSLSWKDSLKKEMATHSSILAWKTQRTEQPDGLQSMESQKSRTQLSISTTAAAKGPCVCSWTLSWPTLWSLAGSPGSLSCSHFLQVTTYFDPTSSTSADSAISFLRNSLSSLICRSLPSYMLLLAFY